MKKLLIPLFCLFLIQCKKNETQALNASMIDIIQEDKVEAVSAPISVSEKMIPPSQEVGPENPPSQSNTITKKIIKNGEMRIQVGDIKKAQEKINSILKDSKAYIQKEEFQN